MSRHGGTDMSMVMGHRGARFEAPENTAQGFAHLMQLSRSSTLIQGAELDIQLSKDGVWMVAHDPTFMRKAGVRKHLEHMDAADIEAVPLSRLSQQFDSELMLTPRLDKVLGLIESLSHIELEVKTHSKTNIDRLIEGLKLLLPALGDNITLTSFNCALLYALKQEVKQKQIKTGWLIDTPVEPNYVVDTAKHLGVGRVCLSKQLPTAELIHALKDNRFKTTVWTVNKKKQARRFSSWGVDSLITDEPKKIAQSLMET